MARRTTIFKQLILNVVIPAAIALVVLAALNYRNTRRILVESLTSKNFIISDGIKKVIEFQEKAFGMLDETLSDRMRNLSERLVNEYLANTGKIETANLSAIQGEIGMLPWLEDIYIINREGVIVNTTFEKDKGLNLFAFGEEHRNYLMNVFDRACFVDEKFTIEATTKRPRKYTYQPTPDGKYIIELGVYSEKADEILSFIESAKKDVTAGLKSVIDVELFFMADVPFSLNPNAFIIEEHESLLRRRFLNRDTITLTSRVNRRLFHYAYMYMERENTELYKGAVLRIISDRTTDKILLRRELIKFLVLFGLTTIAVVVLIYRKARVITDPIKKLVENVNRISNGHFDERADVIGNNEITNLSEQFNLMIEQLEVLYNDLEQKVRERTAEIERQKEEIEAQRDSIEEQRNILAGKNIQLNAAYNEIEEQQRHITDSIYYARRIQTAILPPDDFIKNIVGDIFIYYRPKDIVSGDFYWIDRKDGLIMIAAVDCTGHGVPGAFMSIVGYNQLNYAVNVQKARQPNVILNHLNEGVTRTLREKTRRDAIKDGMDIALCTIDPEKMMLQYAGAYNPIILIRNEEIHEIKGDKFPIGAFIEEAIQDFTNHDMEVKPGDAIYLFSDGYADQFGGPENKKFMMKQFRKLLLSVHSLPVDEQKQVVHNTFEDWKGKEEQVDDILIIGVKI